MRSAPSAGEYKKTKIHSSCDIDKVFVETHIRKLYVILESRVLRVVRPH